VKRLQVSGHGREQAVERRHLARRDISLHGWASVVVSRAEVQK
jgi:hypothetical protein